MPAIGAGGD